MDKSSENNIQLQSPAPCSTSKSRIQVTHFILSICVLSFIFSRNTTLLLSTEFGTSLTFFLHMLSHTLTARPFVFLIFNGILVFLAKTSECMCISSTSDLSNPLLKKLEHCNNLLTASETLASIGIEFSAGTNMSLETLGSFKRGESEITSYTKGCKDQQATDTHLGTVKREDRGNRLKLQKMKSVTQFGTNGFLNHEESDKEEDNDSLSTEELNKRFDDFIRRMKEDIRVGAT